MERGVVGGYDGAGGTISLELGVGGNRRGGGCGRGGGIGDCVKGVIGWMSGLWVL